MQSSRNYAGMICIEVLFNGRERLREVRDEGESAPGREGAREMSVMSSR